jgi:hypothetical protein
MDMRGIATMEELERELNKQSLDQRERTAEYRAAVVLKYNTFSDLFAEDYQYDKKRGKPDIPRSVASQFNNWKKSGSFPSVDVMCFCCNADDILRQFEAYIADKYRKKPTQRSKWSKLFSEDDFRAAVLLFLKQKAFDSKAEMERQGRPGFLTTIGFEYYMMQQFRKIEEEKMHIAANRVTKFLVTDPSLEIEQAVNETLLSLRKELAELRSDLVDGLARVRKLALRQSNNGSLPLKS